MLWSHPQYLPSCSLQCTVRLESRRDVIIWAPAASPQERRFSPDCRIYSPRGPLLCRPEAEWHIVSERYSLVVKVLDDRACWCSGASVPFFFGLSSRPLLAHHRVGLPFEQPIAGLSWSCLISQVLSSEAPTVKLLAGVHTNTTTTKLHTAPKGWLCP